MGTDLVVLFLPLLFFCLIVVVVILRVPSSRPDGCKRLCGWLGVYLDGDDLFLRALLPGSNVSSSRLGPDMPRHENYHAQTHAHTHTHTHTHTHFLTHALCLSLGRSVCVCTTGRPALVCQKVPVRDLKVFSVDTRATDPPPAWLCSLSHTAPPLWDWGSWSATQLHTSLCASWCIWRTFSHCLTTLPMA